MKKGRHLNVVLKILFLIGATSKHFQNCHTPPLFSPEPIEMPYLNSNAPNKYFASKYHHDQHYPGEYGNHESNRMVNSNSFDYYPKVQVRLWNFANVIRIPTLKIILIQANRFHGRQDSGKPSQPHISPLKTVTLLRNNTIAGRSPFPSGKYIIAKWPLFTYPNCNFSVIRCFRIASRTRRNSRE